jgi:hypothetical protein
MPLVDPNAPLHIPLVMVRVAVTGADEPWLALPVPHVVITLSRDVATLASVQYAVLQSLHNDQLRMAPTDQPNFVTNAFRAVRAHTAPYRGSRSVLRGFPAALPLRLYFAFVDPASELGKQANA